MAHDMIFSRDMVACIILNVDVWHRFARLFVKFSVWLVAPGFDGHDNDNGFAFTKQHTLRGRAACLLLHFLSLIVGLRQVRANLVLKRPRLAELSNSVSETKC